MGHFLTGKTTFGLCREEFGARNVPTGEVRGVLSPPPPVPPIGTLAPALLPENDGILTLTPDNG